MWILITLKLKLLLLYSFIDWDRTYTTSLDKARQLRPMYACAEQSIIVVFFDGSCLLLRLFDCYVCYAHARSAVARVRSIESVHLWTFCSFHSSLYRSDSLNPEATWKCIHLNVIIRSGCLNEATWTLQTHWKEKDQGWIPSPSPQAAAPMETRRAVSYHFSFLPLPPLSLSSACSLSRGLGMQFQLSQLHVFF